MVRWEFTLRFLNIFIVLFCCRKKPQVTKPYISFIPHTPLPLSKWSGFKYKHSNVMKCQNKGCPRDTVLWSVFLECEKSHLCDHRVVVQKHCHVDWSKGRQNHLCVHSSKAVHHHVLHLDVFFVEVPFISALRTNSDLCLCGCVIFLSLYPTDLFYSFLLVHHFQIRCFSSLL